MNLPALLTDATQVTLVQRCGVDIGGAGVKQCAMHQLTTQHRNQRAGLVSTEQASLCNMFTGLLVLALQLDCVTAEIHHQLATWREQGMLGEAGWRGIVENATGGRQRADLGRAVGDGIQRR